MKRKKKNTKASSPTESRPKSEKVITVLYWFTFLSFLVPVVFLIWQIAVTDPERIYEEGFRSRADYVLMLVQCLLGILVLHLPGFLTRRFKLAIPNLLYILYILFLYCAIFLGEVRNFYFLIPHWDIILHAFSSVMTGLVGFMVVTVLNQTKITPVHLSPFFVALFSFAFAVTVGTLWEIYEFSFDGLLGMNMQKFLTENGTALIGRQALSDTMEDLIVDCLGALAASLTGYFSLKHQRGWLYDYMQEDSASPK